MFWNNTHVCTWLAITCPNAIDTHVLDMFSNRVNGRRLATYEKTDLMEDPDNPESRENVWNAIENLRTSKVTIFKIYFFDEK